MPRKKKRAGMASCIVSAELFQGKVMVNAVAIYPSKEERDAAYQERTSAPVATFPADIWIEEH